MVEQLSELKNESAKHGHKIAVHEKEMARLRVEMEGNWLRDDRLAIRRRFIDCYKRDISKLLESHQSKAIKAGNMIAHQVSSISDAYLFKNDNRMDYQTYC